MIFDRNDTPETLSKTTVETKIKFNKKYTKHV